MDHEHASQLLPSYDCQKNNKCLHGMLCKAEDEEYYCLCDAGFKGLLCAEDINECDGRPCMGEFSQCLDQHLGFVCHCQAGLNGTTCEIDINECSENPCNSSISKCYDNLNDHMCITLEEIDQAKLQMIKLLGPAYYDSLGLTVDQVEKVTSLDQFYELVNNAASSKANNFSYNEESEQPEYSAAALTATVKSMIPFLLHDVSPQMKKSIGFSEFDLIVFCSVKGNQKCDWTFKYNHRYGNCYTYNNNRSHVVYMDRSGAEQGIKLVLNSHPHHSLSFTETVGLRMVLHSQEDMAYPENEGFTVNPGYATTYAMKYVKNELDPKLIHRCIASKDNVQPFYYEKYSISSCQKSRIQKEIERNCSCCSPNYAKSKSSVQDCGLQKKSCVDETENRMFNFSYSDCRLPCDEEVFKVISSQASQILSHESHCHVEEDPSCGIDMHATNHIASLTIYYDTLRAEIFKEVRKTTFTSLLSNVGGLMGLMVGGSVISLAEILFMIVDFIRRNHFKYCY